MPQVGVQPATPSVKYPRQPIPAAATTRGQHAPRSKTKGK